VSTLTEHNLGHYIWDNIFPVGPGAATDLPEHVFFLQSSRWVSSELRHFSSQLGHATRDENGEWIVQKPALTGHWNHFSQAIWGSGIYSLSPTNHLLFYTGLHCSDAAEPWRQRIGLARSRSAELCDWQRVTDEPILSPAWPYRTIEADECGFGPIFRDPYPFVDDDGRLHVAFAARLADVAAPYNACIGHAVAKNDEFTEWELLPPLVSGEGRYSEMEVPQVIKHNDAWYVTFTVHLMHYSTTWAQKIGGGRPGLHCYVGATLETCSLPANRYGSVLYSRGLRGPRVFGQPAGNVFMAQGWMDDIFDPDIKGLSPLIKLKFEADEVRVPTIG